LDDDRRLNAQRFDDFFYQHHGAEPEMPHQTAQSIPETSAVDADAAAALTKLLANLSLWPNSSKILQRTYNPLYINSDSFPIGKTAAVLHFSRLAHRLLT